MSQSRIRSLRELVKRVPVKSIESQPTPKLQLPQTQKKGKTGPFDEFPAIPSRGGLACRIVKVRRMLSSVFERVCTTHNASVLSVGLFLVGGSGALEASCFVANTASSMETFQFLSAYAWENMFTGCVSISKDAVDVAHAHGLEAEKVLHKFDGVSPQEDSHRRLRIDDFTVFRRAMSNLILMSTAVHTVQIAASISERYEHRVMRGREPLITASLKERVIRMCGAESDATEVTLERAGQHILPVYENPDFVRRTVRRIFERTRMPVFWRVPEGMYGRPEVWRDMGLNENMLLFTNTGKNLLYMEADTTLSEMNSINDAPLDLTLDEAAMGFRQIEQEARRRFKKPFDTFRVVLGHNMQEFTTGGGHQFTAKQRLCERDEVDVFIDSRLPVLAKVLEWLKDKTSDADKRIILETEDQEYFRDFGAIMLAYGYNVVDSAEVTAMGSAEELKSVPRLVHYDDTTTTINAAVSLATSGHIDVTKLCAVFDKKDGRDHLDNLPSHMTGFKVICVSYLYDDLFRQVRTWARQGYTAAQIQAELDARHAHLDVLSERVKEELLNQEAVEQKTLQGL